MNDFCARGSIAAFLNLLTVGDPSEEMMYRMSHWVGPSAWVKQLFVLHMPGDGFAGYGEQLFFPASDIKKISGMS